jgi:hypothetical protein
MIKISATKLEEMGQSNGGTEGNNVPMGRNMSTEQATIFGNLVNLARPCSGASLQIGY